MATPVKGYSATVAQGLLGVAPSAYYKKRLERKEPIAPVRLVLTGFFFEIVATIIAFSVMCWFFYNQPNQKVTVVPAPLSGQSCSVLSPKSGTFYYSKDHSENGQFASPTMTADECVAFLKSKQVCEDTNRFDYLALWGVAEVNHTQYHPGGKGYLSFSPTEISGASTTFSALYGQSVSFPKPDITPAVTRSATFPGSSNNLYIFNFAKGTAQDAFVSYPGVSVASLAYDAKNNILADLTSIQSSSSVVPKPKLDYDLSSSTIDDSFVDAIGLWKMDSKGFNYIDIGYDSGTYHALRTGPNFGVPNALAVDWPTGSNTRLIFVADSQNSVVRKVSVDPWYQMDSIVDISADSNNRFSSPSGLALDPNGNLFISDDSQNKLYYVAKGAISASVKAVVGYTFSNLAAIAFWRDNTNVDYLYMIDNNYLTLLALWLTLLISATIWSAKSTCLQAKRRALEPKLMHHCNRLLVLQLSRWGVGVPWFSYQIVASTLQ